VQVNYAFDGDVSDPDALLDRYTTLTGWSEAVAAAGARRSAVVQRFHRRAHLVRNGVDYVFADRGLARAVSALRPDVAHVNGLAFAAPTWWLRRLLPRSTAIVVQNHSDTGPMGRAPVMRLIGRATRGAPDAFLFAADEHVARWRDAGFIGAGRRTYQVMESSTRMEPIDRALAREASGVAGAPALLWVGRLNANKDPLTVLDAFDRALAALPGATLTMVCGASEMSDAVRARLGRAPLLGRGVRLVGAVPHCDMSAFFSAADLFVAGSHHEGSGYSLIEALACGVTPVVTDIPTFRLLTGGGAVGALWTPGDAAGCARAIVEASGRVSDAERVRVREHFVKQFSWAEIGRRALEIYEDVLARRARLWHASDGP
jgi:glycosyltransferase involved in cell wall biosynthesis